MATTPEWKFVVWERLNKTGKWCPYSAEVSQLLEQANKKALPVVLLGDADDTLKIYSVNLKESMQISEVTGTKSAVRRILCDTVNEFCKGFTWQWSDNHDLWHSYDVDVNNFIEQAFVAGRKSVTLNKAFRGYHYEINFTKMSQTNKQTKRKRTIQRKQHGSPYPVINAVDNKEQKSENPDVPTVNELKVVEYPDLSRTIPGSENLEDQVNNYMRNVQSTFGNVVPSFDRSENEERPSAPVESAQNNNQSLNSDSQTSPATAIVNGHPYYESKPPHTPPSQIKPVPGINPLLKSQKVSKKPKKKKKKALLGNIDNDNSVVTENILEEFTNTVISLSTSEDEDCIICCESLTSGSSYDGDTTVLKLKLCSHMFHKACLLAMYNSGPKDQSLQCPTCKRIHGEKCGVQPPGSMIYHVLPYSLPTFTECDTIRIIYDMKSGTQGPEHPQPGKRYTARGFPRHCFLPDNESGRKILRLLIKAWKRRLIFTIGTSSTTSEENTVTWNEIHHKTEFGYNRRGHGYPDPNYFDNVLGELEAHGVKDDDVYLWYPAT